MSATTPFYLELVDFIASGTTPQEIADFHPSKQAQERLAELIEREKELQLTPEEAQELNHFLELEHLLRMAKARAHLIIAEHE